MESKWYWWLLKNSFAEEMLLCSLSEVTQWPCVCVWTRVSWLEVSVCYQKDILLLFCLSCSFPFCHGHYSRDVHRVAADWISCDFISGRTLLDSFKSSLPRLWSSPFSEPCTLLHCCEMLQCSAWLLISKLINEIKKASQSSFLWCCKRAALSKEPSGTSAKVNWKAECLLAGRNPLRQSAHRIKGELLRR